MAAMTGLAVSQVRRHPGRIVAVLLAVMISVGYLTATLGFMATDQHAIADSVTARTAAADVVVTTADGTAAALRKPLAEVRTTPGIKTAELSYSTGGSLGQEPITLQSMPQNPQLEWASLDSGRWPTNDHQIAIGRVTARQQNVGVGATIAIDLGNGERKLQVTGIVDESRSLFSGLSQNGFVVPGFFTDPHNANGLLLVIGDGTQSQSVLATTLQHRLGHTATATTADAYNQSQLTGLSDGTDVLRNLLLIFGAIAMLVGTILIVNTFLILLAQRRRQIGLLRAVGATGGQVRRSLLLEALITGVIGSLLGVAVGIGISAIAAGVSGSLHSGLVIPPTVAAAGGVGVLVTLLAAIGPTGRATRVTPLDALQPVVDAATNRRMSMLTAIPSVLVTAAGGALIAYGLHYHAQPLLLGVAGSIMVAVGVLIGAKLYFPALMQLLGLITRPLGPIGRLATSNTARNPGRAAATGAALMLATGLIVTLQVGAASVKQSTSLMFDQHYPVDITLASDGSLPTGVVDQVAGIDGVASVAPVRIASVKITTTHHQTAELRMISGEKMESVINPGAGRLPPDSVLIDPLIAQSLNLKAGDTITVRHGSWQHSERVQPSRIAADDALVVPAALMAEAAPRATISGVWAKADPSADVVSVNSALTKITKAHSDLALSGSLTSKASYDQLLDTLLTIATVLLGVAVMIALIGVGNTLGLSVIERSRESALLRALGLQRGQLRLMLAIEAVLLAVGGAFVGIAAGAFFGWIGTAAIATQLEFPTVVFAMSAPQTILVAAVAIVAGVLASILPGRRAAMAAPIEALAEV